MPNKKPKAEKKSKQPKSLELTEDEAASVRGGADGSVRTINPTNAAYFNPKELSVDKQVPWKK